MIDHLMEHKFNHWDATVRELTAQCLFNLTSICPDYIAFCVLPKLLRVALSGTDLNTRHGTLYAMGQCIHGLCEIEQSTSSLARLFPSETMAELKNAIDRIFDEKYFRGSGGESIRPAVCFCIKKISLSDLIARRGDVSLGEMFVRDCFKFMTQCIEYNKESVQAAAVDIIPFYCDLKYKTIKLESVDESNLIDTCIKNLTDTNKGIKMEFCSISSSTGKVTI